jgi:hypothetical protein
MRPDFVDNTNRLNKTAIFLNYRYKEQIIIKQQQVINSR